MASIFCKFDDKHLPLYRVVWISDLPHFCGDEECTAEGRYEARLEQGESLYGSREDRDALLEAMEAWHEGADGPEGPDGGAAEGDHW